MSAYEFNDYLMNLNKKYSHMIDDHPNLKAMIDY